MNRGQIRTAVLQRLGRSSSDPLLDQTTLDNLCNEALHYIASEYQWPWLETTANITTTNGTDTYACPASWIDTVQLRIAGLPPLRRLTLSDLDAFFPHSSANGGTPVAFALRGANVVLRPTPITGALPTVVHTYITDETDLASDGTSPVMPAQFHTAIVAWVAWRALLRTGDMARAKQLENDYAMWLARMIEYARRRQHQNYETELPIPALPGQPAPEVRDVPS